MRSLLEYLNNAKEILLLNNETFYEDYVNNRSARNGIRPQPYLTEEQERMNAITTNTKGICANLFFIKHLHFLIEPL